MLRSLLSFEFLVILNLFVILLWPASGAYWPASADTPNTVARRGRDVISVILLILTVIAVILDIFFLVLSLVH